MIKTLIALTILCYTATEGSILSQDLNRTCSNTFECSDNMVCYYHNQTNSTTCDYCTLSTQCSNAYGSVYECLPAHGNLICLHKKLWPLEMEEILTAFLLFLGGAVAAGGGIGGGGVFIPLLILLGGFQIKDAVPISNMAIAGASIANYIQLGPRKHPNANRPLIDYDLSLLMQPLALSGTVIGVVLNTIFPEWLVLILMIVTLITTTYRTAKKGYCLYYQEKIKFTPELDDGECADDEIELLKNEKLPLKSKETTSIKIPKECTDICPELKNLLETESKTPWFKIFVLVCVLILVSVYSLLVGGKGDSMVGVEVCSMIYWGVFVTIFPVLFLITGYIAWFLINLEHKRERLYYQFSQGDIRWTPENTLVTSLLSLLAGILASLLGIGGGMVLSPVMLDLGVLPAVTAATASYMILFTSISSCVQFAVLDRILWDYGGMFTVLGFLSAVLGQTFLNWLVKKYNKKSYIIFCIVIVIGLSTLLLSISSGMRVADQLKNNAYMGFNSYCSNE